MIGDTIQNIIKNLDTTEMTSVSTETRHNGAPSEAQISANRYQYQFDKEQRKQAEQQKLISEG